MLFSTILGFWQEKSAGDAVNELLNLIKVKTTVLRDGKKEEIFVEEVVMGDIVFLSAGDIIPADGLIIEEDELFVDEATFTGETFPVEKKICVLDKDTPLNKRINSVFMGSHVVSGTGTVLIISTGKNTELGYISEKLSSKTPLTDFEIGIKRFGALLMEITLIMVIFLFAVNVLLNKPFFDSLLFTLALAVGLTPQLLPAIISVNLAKGAKQMAKKKVIVKRLNSIENFGNMTVMCSDKTGTLTEGKVEVDNTLDYLGNNSEMVLKLAKINATLQQGFKNLIDNAISSIELKNFEEYVRVDEIPYDFIRKRLSLLVRLKSEKNINNIINTNTNDFNNNLSNNLNNKFSNSLNSTDNIDNKNIFEKSNILITKGAVIEILSICSHAVDNEGKVVDISTVIDQINALYNKLSSEGFRTLAVAYRDFGSTSVINRNDESQMIFTGFISLFDPPKDGIKDNISDLNNLEVEIKVITGDNALIAKNMAKKVGMNNNEVLTGSDIQNMSDAAFVHNVSKYSVFAEIEPNQKERIILALKSIGKVVGYMGDGINDVSAIHSADVGLSVNTAVDVAKEAADMVLLDKDLEVLIEGIKEGRRTFANTQKYIFMATSANFGNMFSMAGASIFLPFLPLLPKQVLLTNLMTNIPSMALPSDNVDDEWIKHPRGWDLSFIKKFMIVFGILSSVFDYITFGVLIFLFKASEVEFQTGWFIESVVSATLIVLVIRTRKSFTKSKPSKYLAFFSISIALFVMILPYIPFASILGLNLCL
ncbi:HAD-IC family P-type ATPase [Methanobrevibacter arboriphilus]|uniref:HAD-IC family P-type ATPase n=1 Tax=Methanobrevibacter arboriphilus TaxID=39441 RepID=UPI0024AFEC3D|nr:HAD-IC family P-type ATPase [Methanobrevibacter arboriphilus]